MPLKCHPGCEKQLEIDLSSDHGHSYSSEWISQAAGMDQDVL